MDRRDIGRELSEKHGEYEMNKTAIEKLTLGETIKSEIHKYFGQKVLVNKELIRHEDGNKKKWMSVNIPETSGVIVGVRHLNNGYSDWWGDGEILWNTTSKTACLLIAHHPHRNCLKVPLDGIVSLLKNNEEISIINMIEKRLKSIKELQANHHELWRDGAEYSLSELLDEIK